MYCRFLPVTHQYYSIPYAVCWWDNIWIVQNVVLLGGTTKPFELGKDILQMHTEITFTNYENEKMSDTCKSSLWNWKCCLMSFLLSMQWTEEFLGAFSMVSEFIPLISGIQHKVSRLHSLAEYHLVFYLHSWICYFRSISTHRVKMIFRV